MEITTTIRLVTRIVILMMGLVICILSVNSLTTRRVNLTWVLPSLTTTPVVNGTYLYRSRDNITFNLLAVVQGRGISYADTNVRPNKTYYYKSKEYCATCSPQLSVFSNTVKFTTTP